jgi:hypothetical protein
VGSLVTFFYSDLENGAGVVRLVEDSLCWFAFQYMDGDEFSEHLSEERKKIEEPMDEKGHERELTWRRCCHNPWEALHHEAIADEAQAKAATIPVSLVFTTTCVFLTLQQTMQDRIETPIVVCFDMTSTSTDGDVCLFVGQTILMNREWAEQKFDVNWKYFVIVLGAGVSGYIERHGQPGWKDQASGAPWVPT